MSDSNWSILVRHLRPGDAVIQTRGFDTYFKLIVAVHSENNNGLSVTMLAMWNRELVPKMYTYRYPVDSSFDCEAIFHAGEWR